MPKSGHALPSPHGSDFPPCEWGKRRPSCLENGGDLLPQQPPSFFRAHFQKGLPFEVYVTGSDAPIGGKQTQDGFTERGLSTARLADNSQALASGKRKRNVPGSHLSSVRDRDMGEAEYFRLTHCTSSSAVIS